MSISSWTGSEICSAGSVGSVVSDICLELGSDLCFFEECKSILSKGSFNKSSIKISISSGDSLNTSEETSFVI